MVDVLLMLAGASSPLILLWLWTSRSWLPRARHVLLPSWLRTAEPYRPTVERVVRGRHATGWLSYGWAS